MSFTTEMPINIDQFPAILDSNVLTATSETMNGERKGPSLLLSLLFPRSRVTPLVHLFRAKPHASHPQTKNKNSPMLQLDSHTKKLKSTSSVVRIKFFFLVNPVPESSVLSFGSSGTLWLFFPPPPLFTREDHLRRREKEETGVETKSMIFHPSSRDTLTSKVTFRFF